MWLILAVAIALTPIPTYLLKSYQASDIIYYLDLRNNLIFDKL